VVSSLSPDARRACGPALVRDLDRFERNISKMTAPGKAAGKKLPWRPPYTPKLTPRSAWLEKRRSSRRDDSSPVGTYGAARGASMNSSTRVEDSYR
jgi:hypothetical protein